MIFRNTLSIIFTLLIWNNVIAVQWWNGWSLNNNNDRYQRENLPVSLPTTKTEFKQLWYTLLDGPIQAAPTIYENHVYIPSMGGTFYCIQADNGQILWQKSLSSIINDNFNYSSRTSAIVYNGMAILGLSRTTIAQSLAGGGAYAVGLSRFTGAVIWKRQVSSHPASIITNSPQLAKDHLFIGISSIEWSFATDATYPCCTFQGSVVALNVMNGQFLWETKMIPDNNGSTNGYSGRLKK